MRTLISLLMATVAMSAGARVPQGQVRSRAECFTSFDAEYFYIAIDVTKATVQASTVAPFGDPLVDDSAAVYLQTDAGADPNKRTGRSVSMAVSAAGGAQLYRGPAATPIRGFDDFLTSSDGCRWPFRYQAVMRPASGGGAGYLVEMAIPWIELGGPPSTGQRLRFNVVLFSASKDAADTLSMAPGVRARGDADNPSLWGELILVEAPIKVVSSAPKARVCARAYSAKPLMDGVIGEGEWSRLTSFAFSEAPTGRAVEVATSATAARSRVPVSPKASRPAVSRRETVAPGTKAARAKQPVPQWTLATYWMDRQCDPRKQVPHAGVTSSSGASLIATHPIDGVGPWFSYDRADWHRVELSRMRAAGIDVALPVVRAAGGSADGAARRATQAMVAALKWLQWQRRDRPQIGLYLDLGTEGTGGGVDLGTVDGRQRAYGAIRAFYNCVPEPFRASVALTSPNGGALANVVVLSAGLGVDDAGVAFLRESFARDFGADLLLIGPSRLKSTTRLDGYRPDARVRGFELDSDGWIRVAAIHAGQLAADGQAPPLLRRSGATYRTAWRQAVTSKPDWVVLDGWNDYANGAEIAPTLEYGMEYSDLTRAYTQMAHARSEWRAAIASFSVAGSAAAGGVVGVDVRVRNVGTATWPASSVALGWRWDRVGGDRSSSISTAPITASIEPSGLHGAHLSVRAPSQPGDYVLVVDVTRLRGRGEVVWFSDEGSEPLARVVRVLPTQDAPPYAMTVLASTLPPALETGGTYEASITVRNDGARLWTKSDARLVARLERVDRQTGQRLAIDLADSSGVFDADVAPGEVANVRAPVSLMNADGTPLAPSSEGADYILRWEFSADPAGSQGASSGDELLAVTMADFGAVFYNNFTPERLPAERRTPALIGLRNRGPQTWLKSGVRIGYHWYYQDGIELVWEDETTPIPVDVPPGGELPEVQAWVTAPAHDGVYWLVWDLKVGDTWASTLPSSRPYDQQVHLVSVVNGRLSFVDLGRVADASVAASSSDPGEGEFDGGLSLPDELTPPYTGTSVACATIWRDVERSGLESSRRISYRWGPKGAGRFNAVRSKGQRIQIADPRRAETAKMVHIVAASVRPGASAGFTLVYSNGSEQFTSLPTSSWLGEPLHGEERPFRFSYTRHRAKDAAGPPASLFHYGIRVAESRKLVAIVLPNAPDVRIIAITVEK